MPAYYNEHDAYAAAWLRNLIAAGHIAPGIVDERSIEDVTPGDLLGFTQCHFFAGIGVWSHALRGAGFPDGRPVWTGSCPCQPFSAAGKGGGFTDERHLWPAWHYLIEQCRPPLVFGEQVASKDGLAWLDLVHADLEAAHYAVGAFDLCAAGVGAPHIRQRLYFVADAANERRQGRTTTGHDEQPRPGRLLSAGPSADARAVVVGSAHDDGSGRNDRGLPGSQSGTQGGVRRVADGVEFTGAISRLPNADDARLEGPTRPSIQGNVKRFAGSGDVVRSDGREQGEPLPRGGSERVSAKGAHRRVAEPSDTRDVADTDGGHAGAEGLQRSGQHGQLAQDGGASGGAVGDSDSERETTQRGIPDGATVERAGSFWSAADWIACRDGKSRPVEPGSFPLAHGAPARVGRLRAYGNAIVGPLAQAFVAAYLECAP